MSPLPPLPRYVEIPEHLSKPLGTSGPRLLEIERSKASFSSAELARYLHGDDYLERKRRLVELFEHEPAFDKRSLPYMSRTDKYKHGLAKDKRFAQLELEHNWSPEDKMLAEELLDMPAAFGLHKSMFTKTLQEQTTDEQKELFLKPAQNYDIIGCYAQTEIGHGSNVQGLETTATYDPATETFVLQSPGLSSAKYWIGGLGRAADHAIVMAQLFTPDGKNGKLVKRGPHPFVVPIRDVKSREPLPGRYIMDIGPKAGYALTDNGFMLLDNVRIPHVNFLAGFSQVDRESGKYSPAVNARLSFGTMTYIRANIVQNARNALARSATVAVRYCAVRRQFADRDAPVMDGNRPAETQVLNYQLVQARVFPVLAQAFACHFTGKSMMQAYEENQQAMAQGDYSRLADVHASSSGLKSLCTIMASDGIEQCRRVMGGHGFSLASGLAGLYADYLPQVTWEGDSYMLSQQLARYLFKTFRALYVDRNAKMGPANVTKDYILRYLAKPDATAKAQYAGDLHSPSFFVEAFGHRAAFLVAGAVRSRDVEKRTWNSLLVDIFRCSVAHSQFVLVKNFADALEQDEALRSQPALQHVLHLMFELFATQTMDAEAAEFLSSGYLSPRQHMLVRSTYHALLSKVRPEAVALVDGFAFDDYYLNSVLGRKDGDVYTHLVQYSQAEPLNATRFNVNIHDDELVVGPEGPTKAKL